jgi:hypothetical protein
MGQFIGRERVYSSINIFQNCQEIYKQQGIGGFFVYANLIFCLLMKRFLLILVV